MPTTRRRTESSSSLWSVDWWDIPAIWPRIEEMVSAGLERSRGEWNTEDVHRALMERRAKLWLSVRDDIVEALLVTLDVRYPQKRGLLWLVLVGLNRGNWMQFQKDIEEYARARGYDHMEAFARKGWARVSDWDEVALVMRKELWAADR